MTSSGGKLTTLAYHLTKKSNQRRGAKLTLHKHCLEPKGLRVTNPMAYCLRYGTSWSRIFYYHKVCINCFYLKGLVVYKFYRWSHFRRFSQSWVKRESRPTSTCRNSNTSCTSSVDRLKKSNNRPFDSNFKPSHILSWNAKFYNSMWMRQIQLIISIITKE